MTAPAKPEVALFALLGRIFAAEIDPAFHAVLRTEGVREIFENIEPGCLAFDLEETAVEYCRLFILPKGVPPLAAAYVPEQSIAIAGLVEKVKAALALEFPDKLPNDHAGVLFALMAWLLENSPEAAAEFAKVALIPWLPAFGEALEKNSQLPIYTAAAKILLAVEPQLLHSPHR